MGNDAILSGLTTDILDTLATYRQSKSIDDLLPLLAWLTKECEPIQTRLLKKEKITFRQYQFLKIYQTLQGAYLSGCLTDNDYQKVIEAIDKTGITVL